MARIIEANSVKLAEEWGRTIATEFKKQLFDDINFDWIKMNFANWAELVFESAYNEENLKEIQVVVYGEIPYLELMIKLSI